ncbi:baseplate wedge subunit [Staphylococcus phage vB_Sau_S24]|nr:baseplate wedge subunit [Staphylococcus phage vB_Sau_S24]WRW34298.1 baseplate wedge subunit [Staphylococcus phage CF7]
MRFKKHVVQYEETMQAIAQRYYGDVSYWIDLVEHNNLKYPYIVETDEEKMQDPERLASTGDTIIIPIESDLTDVSAKEINSRDKDVLVELALGRDLNITADEKYFNEHGTSDNILAFSTNGNGDLDTVKGIDNMKQQLQARLLTPRGSLMLHPNYGSDLHNLFGLNIPEQATLIEMEVLRTLTSDNRVKSANLVDWKIQGNVYSGQFSVEIKSVEESINFVLGQDEEGIFALFE